MGLTNSTNFYFEIVQNFTKNGEEVVVETNIADIVKYSDPEDEGGDDLAILKVRDKFTLTTNSVVFDISKKLPKVGSLLYSVGAPLKSNDSFSTGVVSFVGRIINDLVFDQTTCVVYEGSSGQGVFTTDGKCIGIATLMMAPSLNCIVPVRRMQKWAKQEKVEWALDPSISIPSETELKNIKMEDSIKHDFFN